MARSVAAALAAATVLSGAAVAGPVLGHGDESGLFVEPSSIAAGGAITVRGDLPTTNQVALVMVASDGTEMPLATVPDSGDGHFEMVVSVPASVDPGTWTIQARVAGAHAATAILVVTPAGAAEQVRDRDLVVRPPAARQGIPVTASPRAAAGEAVTEATPEPAEGAAGTARGSSGDPAGAALGALSALVLASVAAGALSRYRGRRTGAARRP